MTAGRDLVFMNFTLRFLLIVGVLVITAHRAPAPISEESPTPASEQSANPKPKRTIKPKNESESSESSAKEKTSSPAPCPTPNRNPFDGTWSGFLNNVDYTMVISGKGTTVTAKSAEYGTSTTTTTCDGVSIRWHETTKGCSYTFTPNPDGKTALWTCTCRVGGGSWSGVFRKTSP
jgi:cytoskeletal protein RodZ